MSIAETIRSLQALTPGELRDVLRKAGASGRSGLERSLAEYPQGMPMRMITHLSAIVSAANEPQPGILSYLAERDEGKVPDRLEHGGKVIVEVEYVNPRASQG